MSNQRSNKGSRGTAGRAGRNDWHQRAAEFHNLAAHAHLAAGAHHNQEDHLTGHEHSKQAMEFATKAFQYSQQAHEKSVNFLNAAKNSPATKPSAKTSGKGKK
jgi:hypothetical protein